MHFLIFPLLFSTFMRKMSKRKLWFIDVTDIIQSFMSYCTLRDSWHCTIYILLQCLTLCVWHLMNFIWNITSENWFNFMTKVNIYNDFSLKEIIWRKYWRLVVVQIYFLIEFLQKNCELTTIISPLYRLIVDRQIDWL